MFCSNCGQENSQGDSFCDNCGTSLGAQYPQMGQENAVRRTSSMAVASLIMGILGFVFLPLIGSILAIVFGIMARKQINREPNTGGWAMAVIGIVLGGIAIFSLVVFICLIILLAIQGIGI